LKLGAKVIQYIENGELGAENYDLLTARHMYAPWWAMAYGGWESRLQRVSKNQ
jgi:hypothetical protein